MGSCRGMPEEAAARLVGPCVAASHVTLRWGIWDRAPLAPPPMQLVIGSVPPNHSHCSISIPLDSERKNRAGLVLGAWRFLDKALHWKYNTHTPPGYLSPDAISAKQLPGLRIAIMVSWHGHILNWHPSMQASLMVSV